MMVHEVGPTKTTDERVAAVVKYTKTKERTLVEIAAKLEISEGAARRVLDHARERGLIEKQGEHDRYVVYKAR
jgi:DNA-binding transcriptional regulator LsrR (DeoR family)